MHSLVFWTPDGGETFAARPNQQLVYNRPPVETLTPAPLAFISQAAFFSLLLDIHL
jgi:hypothetical protein